MAIDDPQGIRWDKIAGKDRTRGDLPQREGSFRVPLTRASELRWRRRPGIGDPFTVTLMKRGFVCSIPPSSSGATATHSAQPIRGHALIRPAGTTSLSAGADTRTACDRRRRRHHRRRPFRVPFTHYVVDNVQLQRVEFIDVISAPYNGWSRRLLVVSTWIGSAEYHA
jgi:hypothetical protein